MNGGNIFLLVSALGANPHSRVFYSRVKGEVEDAIRALPYRSVTIARPSLLPRERAELRLGEQIGKLFASCRSDTSRWKAARWRATASPVEDRPGVRIIESREIV